jgi:hypothetical protein
MAVIRATLWAVMPQDYAAFYWTDGDSNPSWQLINTVQPQSGGGEQVVESGEQVVESALITLGSARTHKCFFELG